MKRLRELRKQNGLSQQKLAEKFNLTQQAIYKYENGLSEPDIQTLMNLADYFNTSVDYLIGFTGSDDIEYIVRELQLTREDSTFLKKYLALTARQKKALQDITDCLLTPSDTSE